jgi:hypothetical protein
MSIVYLPDIAIAINLAQITAVSFRPDGITVEFSTDVDPVELDSGSDARALVDALCRLADDASGRAMRARTARKGDSE